MGCFLLQKKHSLNASDFVGFIAPHFPRKISPNIALKTSHHHPASHLGRVFHHGASWGCAPPFFLPLRISAHSASSLPFCCSKRIAQILALNAQNRTLLQKARFFCCKNHAVAASKTRSPSICSAM